MNKQNTTTIIEYIENFYFKNYGSDIDIKKIDIILESENNLKVIFDYYDPEIILGDDNYQIGNFDMWGFKKDQTEQTVEEQKIIYGEELVFEIKEK